MHISKDWLKEYIPNISNFDNNIIAERLTQSLAEVEGVEEKGKLLEKIVVGEITEIKKHPDADKLVICQVDIGTEEVQIVTGAPNVEEEAKVPVCLAGGSVIDPESGKRFQIKSTKLRGVESNGMICSERELGISEEHEGILILPESYKVGSEFDDEIRDSIFEIENKSLAHRGDCFSHYGIARELSAILDIDLLEQEVQDVPVLTDSLPIEIQVETKKCRKFSAITIKDIEVKESPFWLKLALGKIGVKPVNNVVDIANYVMHAFGQPLHTYDYNKVKDNKLIVRESRAGEKISAIDHNEYTMDKGDIVITDGKNIQATAGIIGAANSEVTKETKDIVIESAVFDEEQVLKTSRNIGLRTDAVVRFSKGVDPENVEEMLKLAANLITEVAGGDVGSEILTVNTTEKEDKKENELNFDFQLARRTIGLDIEVEQALTYLKRLGISVADEESIDTTIKTVGVPIEIRLNIPSWRHDLEIPEDIVEEIARIHGYDLIEPKVPTRLIASQDLPRQARLQREVRNILLGLEFDEVISYSFISEELKERFEMKDRHLIRVENAISPELKYVRNTLAPSLLDTFRKNYNNFPEQNIFEIGRITNTYERNEKNIPEQPWHLGIMQVAKINKADKDVTAREQFLTAKGRIEELLLELSSRDNTKLSWEEFKQNEFPLINEDILHPGRRVQLIFMDEVVGWFAQIHPRIVNRISSEEYKLFCAEINLEKLEDIKEILSDKDYHPISAYPEITRDVTFVLNELDSKGKNKLFEYINRLPKAKETASEVDQTVRVELSYKSDYITDSETNITYSFKLIPQEDTLTKEQGSKIIEGIIDRIREEFKVSIKD